MRFSVRQNKQTTCASVLDNNKKHISSSLFSGRLHGDYLCDKWVPLCFCCCCWMASRLLHGCWCWGLGPPVWVLFRLIELVSVLAWFVHRSERSDWLSWSQCSTCIEFVPGPSVQPASMGLSETQNSTPLSWSLYSACLSWSDCLSRLCIQVFSQTELDTAWVYDTRIFFSLK